MKKIAIHSVPRSGSTWLGEIFNSSDVVNYNFQPLFSYAFKDRLNDNSSKEEIDVFFDDLINTDDEFINQTQRRNSGKSPNFKKENILNTVVYKEVRYHHILENLLDNDKDVIIIGLVRNPLSVINSWLKAPKEFRKDLDWNELEEWRFAEKKNLNKVEEFIGYQKWKQVALLFEKLAKKYPKRFCLIKYNELLKNPFDITKKMFDFCGLELKKQTIDFLNESRKTDDSNDAYSVYRKVQTDDKWKNSLNSIIVDDILKDLKDISLKKYL